MELTQADPTVEIMKALVVLRRSLRGRSDGGGREPRLSVAQVHALLHVALSGPISMGELSQQMGISHPAATDLVDRLVAAGRLERVASPSDRRKVVVQLTPEAQKIAEEVLAVRLRKVACVLDQLHGAERTGFVRGIQMLAQALAGGAGLLIPEVLTWGQEAVEAALLL